MVPVSRHGSSRPARYWSKPFVALAVLVMHAGFALLLIRAFSPELFEDTARGIRSVLTTFEVEPQAEPLPKPPETKPTRALAQEEGASAPPAKQARPRPSSAPSPRVVLTEKRAPPVAGKGLENSAGASEEGAGSGAAGEGVGTGAGATGQGTGGGGRASPTVKIAGDINSARDYPRAGRQARLGHSVIIDLQVNVEGEVSACRIHRPSPDPDADRITCELATKRFRFRPASNARGEPVPAIYRWKQRWFCC